MNERCFGCPFAEMDFEEYYGTKEKQWFVCGCKLSQEENADCRYLNEEE